MEENGKPCLYLVRAWLYEMKESRKFADHAVLAHVQLAMTPLSSHSTGL